MLRVMLVCCFDVVLNKPSHQPLFFGSIKDNKHVDSNYHLSSHHPSGSQIKTVLPLPSFLVIVSPNYKIPM